MRFDALELLAFGPFTDRRLDLRGDFHLLYGANEAGKSSALRALVDVLYGIPANTTDAHVHEMPALRIGARLRAADGQTAHVIRRKGNKATLLDPSGKVLGDDALAPFLGGVGRTLFTTMFGLDHPHFVAGAESLLLPEGSLGAVLFGASTGTRVLERVLAALEQEADDIYRPRAPKTRIQTLVREHDAAMARAKVATLAAEEWRQGAELLARRERERDRRAGERRDLAVARTRLGRVQRTLPKLRAWELARAAVSALSGVIRLPADAPERRREAMREREAAARALREAEDEAQTIERDLDARRPAETLLAAQGAIEALVERRASAAADADRLPRLEADLAAADRDIAAREAALGARPPRPDRALRARIQQLARERDRLEDERRSNASRVAELDLELDVLARAEATAPASDADPDRLWALARRAQRAAASETRRVELALELDRARAEEARWAASLVPAPHAGVLIPSTETISRHGTLLEEGARALEKLEASRAEGAHKRSEALRALDELMATGAPPSETELTDARRSRDEALRALLAGARGGSDVAVWRAIEAADALADRLRREADRAARRGALEAQVRACDREADRAEAERAQLVAAADAARRAWAAEWGTLGPSVRTPREMAGWRDRYHEHAEARRRVAEAASKLEAIDAELAAVRAELAAVGDAGAPSSLEVWASWAEEHARRSEEARRAAADRAARRARLAAERSALEARVTQAHQAAETWRARWHDVVRAVSQPDDVGPDAVMDVLEAIEALHARLDARATLSDRLQAHRAQAEAFASDVDRVVGSLVHVVPAAREGHTALQRLEVLQLHLQRGLEDAAVVRQLETSLARARTSTRDARARREAAAESLAQLMAAAGAADSAALEAAEERADALRTAEENLRRTEAELIAAGGGLELSALASEASGQVPEQIDAELADVNARHQAIDEEIAALDRAIGEDRGRQAGILGQGGAAAATEEAQSVLAELRRQVDRYALVRLGASVLRRHAERYREAHAGPLLARASAHVAALTRGGLLRLEAGLEHDTPVLLGVREGGQRVNLPGMSDGTRDQVYLALRLATFEAYLDERRNEPMPLIVDDILLHFDDQRASAALAVLGELSTRTQVLFFTHHHRLVELARAHVPAARLVEHDLGGPPTVRAAPTRRGGDGGIEAS